MSTAAKNFDVWDLFAYAISCKEIDYTTGTLPAQLPADMSILRITGAGNSTTDFPLGRVGRLFFVANDSTGTLTLNQFGGGGVPIVLATATGAVIYCDFTAPNVFTYRPLVSTSGVPLVVGYPLVVDGTGQGAGTTAIRVINDVGGTGLDLKEDGSFRNGNGSELTFDVATIDMKLGGDTYIHGASTDKCIDVGLLGADTFPTTAVPSTQQIYQSSIERGIIRNPSQDNYDPAVNFGFPNGNTNIYYGDKQINNITGSNCSKGRNTNQIITPGGSRLVSFGTKFAFQDRIIYDALQIRGRLSGVSFTGIEIPRELDRAFFKFIFHFEGRWVGTLGNNMIKCYARQYRGGVFLRDLNLCFDERNNGAMRTCVQSGARHVNGASTLGEDILWRDEFEFYLENDAASANDFNMLLLQAGVEVVNNS